jgi:hypothetical protein
VQQWCILAKNWCVFCSSDNDYFNNIIIMYSLHLYIFFSVSNLYYNYCKHWRAIGIFEDSSWSHVAPVSRLLLRLMHYPLSVFGCLVEQDQGQGSKCGHHIRKLVLR